MGAEGKFSRFGPVRNLVKAIASNHENGRAVVLRLPFISQEMLARIDASIIPTEEKKDILHTYENLFEESEFSRRGFFKGATELALKATFLYIAIKNATKEGLSDVLDLIFPPDYTNRSPVTKNGTTDIKKLKKKNIVGAGDSLEEGLEASDEILRKINKKQALHPPAKELARIANESAVGKEFLLNWAAQIIAERGANAERTIEILRSVDLTKLTVEQLTNVCMLLSLAGNDFRGVNQKDILSLYHNFFQPALLFKVAKDIKLAVGDYMNKFISVLKEVDNLKERGMDIETLCVVGLPDLSLAPAVTFVPIAGSDDKEMVYNIQDNGVIKFFVGRISLLLNNAMVTAIEKHTKSGSKLNILFVDIFKLLKKENFPYDEHYDRAAQILVVKEVIRRLQITQDNLPIIEKLFYSLKNLFSDSLGDIPQEILDALSQSLREEPIRRK